MLHNMRRWMVRLWLLGGILGICGSASEGRAATETFDHTGLSTSAATWVSSGSFTGTVEGVEWTFACGRGNPQLREGDPSMALQAGGTTAQKGWLCSSVLTGGLGRISVEVRQIAGGTVDFDVWAGEVKIGHFVGGGDTNVIETPEFIAADSNRYPVTNDCTLMISNRITGTRNVALDNLTWEPFRLYVRLPNAATNEIRVDGEWDIEAEVFALTNLLVEGSWSIDGGFAGTVGDTHQRHLCLTPAAEDSGKTFALTYTAQEIDSTNESPATASATCWVVVSDALNPRHVSFETMPSLNYNVNTNALVPVELNGIIWLTQNIHNSDATDTKIGTRSARFRHQTGIPAIWESQDSFQGIGTVSFHAACYNSNRVITLELQAHGEDEDWQTLAYGTCPVQNGLDITNTLFYADVNRSDAVWLRLVSTGNAEQIADVDELIIREYGDTLPRLIFTGDTAIPLARPAALRFDVLNRDGIPRTWSAGFSPEALYAVGQTNDAGALEFTFDAQPSHRADYALDVAADFGSSSSDGVLETSLVLRVRTPPVFELAAMANPVTVTNPVDIRVTNVVLDVSNTNNEWTTEWIVEPRFVSALTTSNKSRLYISTGTTAADANTYTLTAVMTDKITDLRSTNVLADFRVVVAGDDLRSEDYLITAYDIANATVTVTTTNAIPVLYRLFALADPLAEPSSSTNWIWSTNATGAAGSCTLSLPNPAPANRHLHYGILVAPAP